MWVVVALFEKDGKEIVSRKRVKLYDRILTKPFLDQAKVDLTQSSDMVSIENKKKVTYQVLLNNYQNKVSLIQEFRITS